MRLRILLLIWALAAFSVPASAMYSEDIGAPVPEVWKAVLTSFGKAEIRKAKENKGFLETKWNQDQVIRSRGLLKKFMSERYDRRSRFKIWIKPVGIGTEIKIQGVYQEKPTGTSPSVSWKKVKPELQDLELERALFFRILNNLEEIKRKS